MRRHRRREELLFSLLLLLFISSPSCCCFDADSIGLSGDFAALIQFKREIASDPAGFLSTWTESGAGRCPCSWTGVFCDGRGRVVGINVSGKRDREFLRSRLEGRISAAIGGLTELRVLSLPFHSFSGEIPVQIWEIPSLEVVNLEGSFISGALPSRFPPRLRALNLAYNQIRGVIPPSLSRCFDLESLNLSHNKIEGAVINLFVNFPRLKVLDLSFNQIGGYIPRGIGQRCPSLEHLQLSSNLLIGVLPVELLQLKKLQILNVSKNNLSGSLPADFSPQKYLRFLDLSQNQLSGEIPEDLGLPSSIIGLDLSWNKFHGRIPASFAQMKNLNWNLLLAGNNLKGGMPFKFLHLRSLKSLDLSSNPLPGKNIAPGRYFFLQASESSKFTAVEIAAVVSASVIVSILLSLIAIYIITRKCLPRNAIQSSERREVTIFMETQVPLTYETVVRATGNFTGSKCIGSGGFGATYKAEIAPGIIFAIKRLSIGKVQAIQHFHAEIKALGTRRHRNLVTLIGYHLSEGETFLIYNYLPGGNLLKFIEERSKHPIDFWVLHKIALDVARALKYLHHRTVRIIHRDVKPSNILLDNEVNAYLSDFGLAKLLSSSETHLTTGVEGTFGYVAPEYATQGRVSEKADVYSYGVVLLELISDKKVLDSSFSNYGHGFNIVSWARLLLMQGKEKEFFLPEIWEGGPRDDLIETLNLAVLCTDALPSARPTMKVVVQRLKQLRSLPSV